MAKKPATQEEADAIEEGLRAAREFEGPKPKQTYGAVAGMEARAKENVARAERAALEKKFEEDRRPRQRKFFDQTGVKEVPPPPGELPPVVPIVHPPGLETPLEEVVNITVRVTRDITIGSVTHPKGTLLEMPEAYGQMLVNSGGATLEAELEPMTKPGPKQAARANDAPEPDEDV